MTSTLHGQSRARRAAAAGGSNSLTPAKCDRCGRMVWWVLTRHGHWQMIDPAASFTQGDIVIIGFGQEARAVVLTRAEQDDSAVRRYRYFAHAVKCRPQDPTRPVDPNFPPAHLPLPPGDSPE